MVEERGGPCGWEGGGGSVEGCCRLLSKFKQPLALASHSLPVCVPRLCVLFVSICQRAGRGKQARAPFLEREHTGSAYTQGLSLDGCRRSPSKPQTRMPERHTCQAHTPNSS